MPFTQLFYHLVWCTRYRHPLLTYETEQIIYEYLRINAVSLGAIVYALNGFENHVHVVASIPSKIAVSKFICQIKAVASSRFNQNYPNLPAFYWQAEYGAFTFDRKRLPNYVAYVQQ